MIRRHKIIYGIISIIVIFFLTSCMGEKQKILDPQSPTVVTLWHSYGSYAKTVFDSLVDEFNNTVGLEKGIVIETYGFGETNQLANSIYNSANHIIGSDSMPNVFMSYPDNAYRIDQLMELVEMKEYFTSEEIGKFRKEFLEEGIWEDAESSKIIPVSKSTEIMYLNKTDWDIFSQETGTKTSSLGTWEGLLETAEIYYKWSGGKSLLGFNPSNDFVTLTAIQLENEPYQLKDGKMSFNYSKETAKRVWDVFYVPVIKGWFKSGRYCQDWVKSGGLLAYIGSSAGANYFPDEVIIDAENSYPIESMILAYPTFEGKRVYMSQRGAGLCIVKSDKEHEYAAAEFIKWFTQPDNNCDFTLSTGYIPVENEAITSAKVWFDDKPEAVSGGSILKSVDFILTSMDKYSFIINKPFSAYYQANEYFYKSIFEKVTMDKEELELRVEHGEDREELVAGFTGDYNFDSWYKELSQKVSDYLK